MAFERKVRSVGTKSVTYPWLRRYVTFIFVRGSVRQTIVESAATRATVRAFDAAAARRASRRRSKPGQTPPG